MLKRKRNRSKMESLVLSTTATNQNIMPNLTGVAASPRSRIFNQSVWNFLINTREVICMTDPSPPGKGWWTCPQTTLFIRLWLPCPRHSLPINRPPFCTALQSAFLFATYQDAAQFMNRLIKPIRLSNVLSWGFPGGTVVKNLPADAGDVGSSPSLGRSHMPRSN